MLEDEQTEFKQQYSDSIIKEVIAFLNSDNNTGGTIYVGMNDIGEVVGLEDAKAIEEKLSNQFRNSISPDASMFISINVRNTDKKDYIIIKVSKGVDVYFLKSKGYEGVYTRTGSCTMPASHEVVKKLLLEKENLSYESAICPMQDGLTFNYAKNIFIKENIDINDENIQKNLHLKDLNGNYTNLAKILSDQNGFPIRVAVYEDDSKLNFVDLKEFTGSIFEIYDKTIDYLKLISHTYGIINGTVREDIEEYPDFILREILFNMCIHRSMELDGPNIINIYKNSRIEFVSLGGLYKISLEDALSGVSYSRNKLLQSIFMRLKRVESIGSGLRRITSFYHNRGLEVDIKALSSSFIVTIPSITPNNSLNDKQLIINYIKDNSIVSSRELRDVVGKERTTTQNIINELLDKKIIVKVGNGPSTKYKLYK